MKLDRVVARALFCAAAFLSFSVPCALAQNSGVISGTVTDTSGGVVAKANVTVTNADTKAVVWHGATNESGVYRVPQLGVGHYDIHVQLQGFKAADLQGIDLAVDQRADVPVTLQAGATTESITVNADTAGQLATDTSSLGSVINTSQVKDLPLPSRAILNLLNFTPGVSSGGDATGINASQLSINGSRTVNNEVTVDGISVVSGSTGGVQTLPPTDAIREFKVLTSAYSAEYGRTSGAVVTVVINSGTNQYHGGAYEYFRNEDLNANNFFNNVVGHPRPQDRYNLFGAKLGGPVWIPKVYNGKERTFFFFNYEGLRQSSPYNNISSVPGAAFRTGNFSSSPTLVYDPTSKAPFPGNVIPPTRINSAATKILGVLPSANSTGTADVADNLALNNLVEIGSSKPTSNATTTRIDENLNDNNRLFGTLTHYNAFSPIQPIIPGPLENAVGPSTTTGYQAAIGLTHTWSPTLFTEIRFGYFRNNSEYVPPSAGLDVPSVLGIQNAIGGAAPTFNISGWTTSTIQYGLNSNTLRSQIDNNFHTNISTTKVWGNHLVKFGFDLRKNQFNIYNPGGTGNSGWFTGNYTFTGEITSGTHTSGNAVNALADFLLGDIKTAGYALPQPPAGRRNYNIGAYVQDDWKFSQKLTLNLGLRYEYESPMTSSNNVYSRVDPTTGQVLFPNINSSASLGLTADKINFGPRVGLAYTPFSKTVVRAGFGIFFNQFFSDLGGQVLFPGYTISQAFNSLGTGIAQPFSLSQGMPLVATQNLSSPQSNLAQFNASNPISASASFSSVNPLPYIATWNIGVQRELFRGTILDVNYVGTAGNHLPLNLPYNQVPVSEGTALAQANTSVTTQNARPYPSIGSFSAVTMAGHSSYNALQLSVKRQLSSNLNFIANYTWSKSIDDGDGLFSFSQPEGLNGGQFPSSYRNLDRALSEFDRTNNLTTAIQYHTQSRSRWLRDFDIIPLLTARTGLPDTINQNNLNPAASQIRPNVINANSIYESSSYANGTGIQFLLPTTASGFPLGPVGPLFTGTGSSRTLVVPAGIGTLGRDTVRTPGELDLDLGLGRRFTIRENLKLLLRMEAFNILNHTNFNAPNTSLTVTANAAGQGVFNSPTFGLITSSRAARFLQMTARIEF
jgi:Carboxypeptidase regulatory-like domain/TonB-dependent Receptor Plug Domain